MVGEKIDPLILCKPYDKPDRYWQCVDPTNEEYVLTEGRRPAGYQSMSEDGVYGGLQIIQSVNEIREHVDKWRADGYPKTTTITGELLRHWTAPKEDKRLFFCQMEAIETIIYMTEVNPGILKSVGGFGQDGSPFQRLCTKMATGTGKTIVMGMLVAWQALNASRSRAYTKNILVVTPGLTVRDRLQVLKPQNTDNVYDDFDLVPAHMRASLNSCRIKITNFHQLKPKEKSHPIHQLGPQGPKSFAKGLFGGPIRNVLVINDEGHHAWRPDEYAVRGRAEKDEAQNAGIWMAGLDMIHAACNITKCHDFTATPFVPTGKSSVEDTLFAWIISDFSLSDAIESGLVKSPRAVPLSDAGGYAYRHLYADEEVRRALNMGNKLPDKVRTAYGMLGRDWKRIHDVWSGRKFPTPPVMITVCNSTRHAKIVEREFERNAVQLPGILMDKSSMLRIDSDVIKKAEAGNGAVQAIREQVNTVGRPCLPGEKICNIISVDMLTEGWDTKTVTHIMGLRAFTSQLLCEQVVGRGLRRTNYEVNAKGYLDPEHVTILGVPFGFLPFEDPGDSSGDPDPVEPHVEIRPEPDRVEHRISWPVVSRIEKRTEHHLDVNWDAVDPFALNDDVSTDVGVGPVIGTHVAAPDDRLSIVKHRQTVEFGILQDMFSHGLRYTWESKRADMSNTNPYSVVTDTLDIIRKFLRTRIRTTLDGARLEAALNHQRAAIAAHIAAQLGDEQRILAVPVVEGIGSTSDMRPKFTKNHRIMNTTKTHLNMMTAHVNFELNIGRVLDASRYVRSWVKGDMVGFYVNYEDPQTLIIHRYRPDFIIHLHSGVQLVLEGKGEPRDAKVKKAALEEWVKAVSETDSHGVWDSDIVYKRDNSNKWRSDLEHILSRKRDPDCVRECRMCDIRVQKMSEAVAKFGIRNDGGFLKIGEICLKCS